MHARVEPYAPDMSRAVEVEASGNGLVCTRAADPLDFYNGIVVVIVLCLGLPLSHWLHTHLEPKQGTSLEALASPLFG